MGYIVDQAISANVKEAFRNLKEKLQQTRDAVPMEFPIIAKKLLKIVMVGTHELMMEATVIE